MMHIPLFIGFQHHPRWLFGISAINSSSLFLYILQDTITNRRYSPWLNIFYLKISSTLLLFLVYMTQTFEICFTPPKKRNPNAASIPTPNPPRNRSVFFPRCFWYPQGFGTKVGSSSLGGGGGGGGGAGTSAEKSQLSSDQRNPEKKPFHGILVDLMLMCYGKLVGNI